MSGTLQKSVSSCAISLSCGLGAQIGRRLLISSNFGSWLISSRLISCRGLLFLGRLFGGRLLRSNGLLNGCRLLNGSLLLDLDCRRLLGWLSRRCWLLAGGRFFLCL